MARRDCSPSASHLTSSPALACLPAPYLVLPAAPAPLVPSSHFCLTSCSFLLVVPLRGKLHFPPALSLPAWLWPLRPHPGTLSSHHHNADHNTGLPHPSPTRHVLCWFFVVSILWLIMSSRQMSKPTLPQHTCMSVHKHTLTPTLAERLFSGDTPKCLEDGVS